MQSNDLISPSCNEQHRSNPDDGYEELFQSIPCPSCRGLGKIPRGMYLLI